MNKLLESLKHKARSLPLSPGCYLMRNRHNEIIYIGKAKELSKRVSSYFSLEHEGKTKVLVSQIVDFDFIISSSEEDALILECDLIKKYKPKFNILLKDDKSFPFLAIDERLSFPIFYVTRKKERDRSIRYIGPFTRAYQLKKSVSALKKSYELRDCTNSDFSRRQEPCLLYQMGECSASCMKLIKERQYQKEFSEALSFFEGSKKLVIENLEKRMFEYAKKDLFKKAALIRDQLKLLEDPVFVEEKSLSTKLPYKNADIISFFVGKNEVDISFYIIRSSNIIGEKNFSFLKRDFENFSVEFLRALSSYYSINSDQMPKYIVLDEFEAKEEFQLFKNFIKSKNKETKVSMRPRQSIQVLNLVKMHAVAKQKIRNEGGVYIGLKKLTELLGLSEIPQKIECYDIAILQGSSPTGAKVVFKNGKPFKQEYRHYHIKNHDNKNDDYAMMKEVFERRIEKGHFPDLFVVDGGKGQLSVVKEVLESKNIEVPLVSIAKSKSRKQTEERLFQIGGLKPIVLKNHIEVFRIITAMRDEAHRFCRILHHKGEEKRVVRSRLLEIPGIGKKTYVEIMNSLENGTSDLNKWTVEEVHQNLGVSLRLAQKIKEVFNSES